MQRLKLLGLSLIAVFALGAAAASVASAETAGINQLPGVGTTSSFTSKAGENTVLENLKGTKIECKSVAGKTKATSDTLGTVVFEFKGCEEPATKVKCTTSGKSAGEILIDTAEYHYRYLLPATTSGVQLVILLGETVVFKCSIIPVDVTGCVSSMDLQKSATTGNLEEELVNSYFVNFLQTGGMQGITSIDNEAGTAMETCELKATINGETLDAGQLGSGTVSGFENGGRGVTVLLMH